MYSFVKGLMSGLTNEEKLKILLESGFTLYEGKILIALIQSPEAAAKEITQLSEVPKNKVYEILENLKHRSIIEELPTKPKKYRAANLLTQLKSRAKTRREEIDNLERRIESFTTESISKQSNEQKFWVTEGADAMIKKIANTLPDIKKESIGYIDIWKGIPENYHAVEKAIARGVKFYFLGSVDNPEAISIARKYIKLGVEIREHKTTGAGYSIFDNRYLQIRVSEQKVISLWIDNKYLANILRQHFFQVWQKANKLKP